VNQSESRNYKGSYRKRQRAGSKYRSSFPGERPYLVVNGKKESLPLRGKAWKAGAGKYRDLRDGGKDERRDRGASSQGDFIPWGLGPYSNPREGGRRTGGKGGGG